MCNTYAKKNITIESNIFFATLNSQNRFLYFALIALAKKIFLQSNTVLLITNKTINIAPLSYEKCLTDNNHRLYLMQFQFRRVFKIYFESVS